MVAFLASIAAGVIGTAIWAFFTFVVKRRKGKGTQTIAEDPPVTSPPPVSVEENYKDRCDSLPEFDLDVIPPLGPLPPKSRMPFGPNPCFVGREGDLKKLANKLDAGTPTAIGQVEAVTGLGGIGKTQLAVQYIHHYACRYPGGVFWLNMEDKDNVQNEVALCGGVDGMDLEGFDKLTQPDQVKRVQAIWRENTPRLLVFDNVEAPETAHEWIPKSGGSRVLITSRCPSWPATMGIEPVPLDTLPRPRSVELLLNGRPEAQANEEEMAAADRICDLLGDLPLAIDLARAYLATYKDVVSICEYESELKAQPILSNPSLVDFVKDPSPTRHIQNVGATFEMSYRKLANDDRIDALAMKLFHMAGRFAPTSISRELLGMASGLDTEKVEDKRLEADAINRLVSVGLIKEEEDGRVLMHRLLREFALHHLPPSMTEKECADAFETAIFGFATEVNRSGLPARLAREVEHLRHAAHRADECDTEHAGRLFNNLGSVLKAQGDLAGAKKYYERALEIDEKALGPDHPNVARDINNLGSVLKAQGDLAGAKKYYERALEIDEKALGPDHPNVARDINNLGSVLKAQGDLAGAKKYYERALAIDEKVYGPDHPNVATYLNNLGGVLLALRDKKGAREKGERALEIYRKFLGDDHPDTIRMKKNLESLGSDE
jgi:tetratricopeptide (TPR) repeat protein